MNSAILHLTEDQIDDVLLGDLASDPVAHLAGCNVCQARIALAEAPIASFKAVSLAWSERRSATLPSKPILSSASSWYRHASWAAAASAVLLLAIAVPVTRYEASTSNHQLASNNTRHSAQPAQTNSTTTASNEIPHRNSIQPIATGTSSGPHAVQIARDNQMLQDIDRELEASVQTPADDLEIQSVGNRSNPRGRPSNIRNWD
jgi:hypothetical protein